jgi:hypothetical protein
MTPEDKELLRHAVLEAVVIRHPTAMAVRAISRHVATGVGFKVGEEDIKSAAEFHVSLGNFTVAPDPLGGSRYYTATAVGVLAYERGGH